MRSLLKKLRHLLLFLCCSLTVTSQLTYDAASAVQYAEMYWGENKYEVLDAQYFPRYSNNNNCCNFINQCIMAGLTNTQDMADLRLAADSIKHEPYWYHQDSINRGRAWSVVQSLFEYAQDTTLKEGLKFQFIAMDFARGSRKNIFMDVTSIEEGDVVFMDWENDGNMDHVMMVTKMINDKIYYSDVRVTGHTDHLRNWPLLAIKMKYSYDVVFYIFRPLGFKI